MCGVHQSLIVVDRHAQGILAVSHPPAWVILAHSCLHHTLCCRLVLNDVPEFMP